MSADATRLSESPHSPPVPGPPPMRRMPAGAQQVASETRDPGQAMDEDFAAFFAKWTSEPRYGSPLVDHLPVVPGIPTPKEFWATTSARPGR